MVGAKVQVRVRLADGREHSLLPGDVIGRMPRAALRIEDPRISDAHALVSLRGAELKLLALRGRMSVDGRPTSAVTLTTGARVVLGGFLALNVLDVSLPERVFALTISAPGQDDLGPLAIDGVTAVHADVPPRVVAGFDPDAALIAWVDDSGAFLRPRDEPDRHLGPGEELACAGLRVRVASVALNALESSSTLEQGRFDNPLTLTLHYDTVHVRPAVGAIVVFDGLAARLLSEIAQLRTPTSWLDLARLVWDDEDDEHVLRYRWDQATSRIRRKLRVGGVRADLLRSTGAGLVELFLGPEDRVEDLS